MAVGLEQFVKSLEDSGIISPSKLRAVREKLPSDKQQDAQELAKELVRQQKLTKFQVQEAYQGKAKNLVLGNYIILDKIGAGGMGQVYKAQHKVMERIVAVKVLPPAVMKDQAAIARFHREVKAAAKLNHSNIVTAHDADQAGGVHFLVMEYVEGSDLSALVKKNGPFSVAKSVDFILQAARGLEAAHSEGVVHRDIKPANLLLDKKGTVKILDMGLARLDSGIGGGNDNPTQAELTSSGQIMGTVDYMSPEQAFNTRQADARADIYSLGCTLYYLLTGKAVFSGESLMEKLLAHREKPIPSLRDVRDDVPEGVDAVLQKMLAKKVEDRYQTMTEVIAELQSLVGGGSTLMSSTLASTEAATSNSNLTFLRDTAAGQTVQRKMTKQTKVVGDGSFNKKLALIGAGVVGVLILAGIIVSLRSKDGTLIVEVDQPDAMVQVLDAEGKVEVSQKSGGGKITIGVDPGKHQLKVEKDGFAIFGQEFEMESGGKKAITAKLVAVKTVAANHALKFGGEADFVEVALLSYPGSGGRTIEAYVTTSEDRSISHVMSLSGRPDQGVMAIRKSGTDLSGLSGLNQIRDYVTAKAVAKAGRRCHVALIWNGADKPILYVDGQPHAKPIGKINKPAATPKFMIGGTALTKDSDEGGFAGVIDEVRISKVARYTGNFTPEPRFTSDADTIALYHFDEGSGDTAHDSSDNGHHAKIVGAKWVRAVAGEPIPSAVVVPSSPIVPPVPTKAFAFGGHSYGLVNGAVTWSAAKAKAEASGGHLATITTKEENDWIKSTILASLPNEKLVWIGGEKEAVSSDLNWAWVTGEPWDFTGWGVRHTERAEPSGAGIIRSMAYGLVWGSWNRNAIPPDPQSGQNRVQGFLIEWDRPNPAAPNSPAPPLAKAPFDAAQAKAHQAAWAKHLGTQVETTNSVGMKMVLIPPGEFLMGSIDEQVEAALKVGEAEKADQKIKDRIHTSEQPQHRVVITKPFLMGATEVTVGQFKKSSATDYQTEAEQAAVQDAKTQTYLNPGYAVTDDSLAAVITWNDAVAFCQWLSEQENTTYRLPTEAEWEYACRAGTTTQYSFGDVALLDQYGWYQKNSGGKSHPVGTKLPNGFGLFDVHGNLNEWCGDFYDERWYEKTSASDPTGPVAGSSYLIRGGSWHPIASHCRSASRHYSTPSSRLNSIGFRIVRELAAPSTTANVTPQPTVPAIAPAKPITDFNSPEFQAWVKEVQALPAVEQVEAVKRKLMELNPEYRWNQLGQSHPVIESGVFTELRIVADNITDISPVRAIEGMRAIYCTGSGRGKGRLSDLSPLEGMGLKILQCGNTQVSDLSPLRGMPLTALVCNFTQVADLSPLHDCKSLNYLGVTRTKVPAAGVAALQKSLPNCKIDWDDPSKTTSPQPASSKK